MRRTRLEFGAIAALLCACTGCAAPLGPRQPPAPPRPAPTPKTFDYRQETLKDIDATTSIEKVLEFQPPAPPPRAAEPVSTVDNEVSSDDSARRVERAHRDEYVYRHTHRPWRHEEFCDNEWCDHHGQGGAYGRARGHGIDLGRTLLYGTVGGVIGHQSGHRDEGILWGVGLGLLEDVLGGW